MPGTHRKAIVKNAKAKMIEGTFCNFEDILRSVFRLPGSVKRMSDDIHHQDVDQKEIAALARSGKLPLFSEFVLTMYRAMDYYNRQKAHRGVLREWSWAPKPSTATPHDCLLACCRDGWRPREISDSALDLIFLEKDKRICNLGRVQFRGDLYEHDALVELHGQKIDIRYNPLTGDLLCFHKGQFLCLAFPVEYSSMKDMDLAHRKIMEKRARRKQFTEEFRRITAGIPDLRQYSQVSKLEKVAALVDGDIRKRAAEQVEMNRQLTPDELEAGVKQLEAAQGTQPERRRNLPARPRYFLDDNSRFQWIVEFLKAGGSLDAEDAAFKARHMEKLTESTRDYYEDLLSQGQ
jgi:hypothetical protein